MKVIFSLLVLLLTGCVTATEVYTETGKVGHAIDCGGTASNWGECYRMAGSICGEKGYTILSKTGEQGYAAGGSYNAAYGGSLHMREMTIQCKSE